MPKRRFGLLNYTTEVSPEESTKEISRVLSRYGARKILTEYDKDGFTSSISFIVRTAKGEIAFRIPIDIEATLRVLQKHRQEGRIRIKIDEERARKVAWRIMKDWVEAQVAIIETEMVKLEQVFLPYAIVSSGKTLYEAMEERLFELPSGEWKEIG